MFGDLWDRFKLAITPESHAESVVNEIYSPENRGMVGLPGFSPEPFFDPESGGTPDIVVSTTRAITEPFKRVGTAISGTVNKFLIIGGVFLLLLVIANAFIRSR